MNDIIDKILESRPFIPRLVYSERIKPFIGKEIIKVITGQRRVGKSYILFQLITELKKDDPACNILYINKELQPFAHLNDHVSLYEYVAANLKAAVNNYLFIDEVQEIKDFEKTLRSLLAENVCDIFISGSNATMLSGELATYLAGRYIEFEVHSLGYDEFLTFFDLKTTKQNLYTYLTLGGMPYMKVIGLNENSVFEYYATYIPPFC
jgi:predicted AAA+ superfamily ATPase